MLKRIARNPLIDLLVHLKGNERACLWTEPLWGIPYNLYVPFVSVYMAALGMTPVQIGAMSTIFFISQMFWALLSGVLTDKLGRRRCTVIFDLLSWSVPTFLWMLAQDYRWFVAAALFNLRIPRTEAALQPLPPNPLSLTYDFWLCNQRLWRDKLGQISLATTTLFWGVSGNLRYIVLAWASVALGYSTTQASSLVGVVAIGTAVGAVVASIWMRAP